MTQETSPRAAGAAEGQAPETILEARLGRQIADLESRMKATRNLMLLFGVAYLIFGVLDLVRGGPTQGSTSGVLFPMICILFGSGFELNRRIVATLADLARAVTQAPAIPR